MFDLREIMWPDWVRMQTLHWLQGHITNSVLCLCNFTILQSSNVKTAHCRTCVSIASPKWSKEPSDVCVSEIMPWGGAPACPACNKTVYPMEQAIAADRKPFHAGCIRCQMKGCGWVVRGEARIVYHLLSIISNDLTARTLHKYEGHNICEKCHEMIFIQKVRGSQRYRYAMRDVRDMRCETYEIWDVRYEIWDIRYEIWYIRCETCETCEIWDVRYEMIFLSISCVRPTGRPRERRAQRRGRDGRRRTDWPGRGQRRPRERDSARSAVRR